MAAGSRPVEPPILRGRITADVAEAFEPTNSAARFVVAMAMAATDIRIARDDVARAHRDDSPDFGYRVRIFSAHLYEADIALREYEQRQDPAIARLRQRIPPDGQTRRKSLRQRLDKLQRGQFRDFRNGTFHYPSPAARYGTAFDTRLADVLEHMRGFASQVDVTVTPDELRIPVVSEAAVRFASDAPRLAVAEVQELAFTVRDAAADFDAWFAWLLQAYLRDMPTWAPSAA